MALLTLGINAFDWTIRISIAASLSVGTLAGQISSGGQEPRSVSRPASDIQRTQQPPTVKWKFQTEDTILGSPIIHNGQVYFGGCDGFVYSIDLFSGKLLWKFKTNKAIISSPIIDNNVVFIGNLDGDFYALSSRDGALIWKFNASGYVDATACVDSDKVYFGGSSAYYAVNKKDGSLVWKVGGAFKQFWTHAKPIIVDNWVFVSSTYIPWTGPSGASVKCLKAGTGELGYEFLTTPFEQTHSIPYELNGNLFIATHEKYGNGGGRIYGFNIETKQKLWTVVNGNGIFNSFATDGRYLYAGTLRNYLHKVDPELAKEMWSINLGKQIAGPPLVFEDIAYIVLEMGELVGVDSNSGEIKFQLAFQAGKYKNFMRGLGVLGERFHGAPAMDQGILVVGERDGFLYGISIKN